MKLTWFGATAFRIHIGGEIVVVDADAAPAGVDRGELLAGAGRVVTLAGGDLVAIDAAGWRPKPTPRATETPEPLEIGRMAPRTLLIAAAGEPPLVIIGAGNMPRFGRWADGAVVVLTADRPSLVADATVILDVARLRLVALAVGDDGLDIAVAELAEHLDGAGLVSLEPGLAVEV